MAKIRTVLVKKADGSTQRVPLDKIKKLKSKNLTNQKTTKPQVKLSDIKPKNEDIKITEAKLLQEIKELSQIKKAGQATKPANNQPTNKNLFKPTKKTTKPRPSAKIKDKPATIDQLDRSKKIYNILKQAQSTPQPVIRDKQPANKAIKTNKWSKKDSQSLLEEKLDKPTSKQPLFSQARDNQVEKIIKQLDFTVAPDNQNRLRSIIQLRLKEIRDSDQTKETLLRPVLQGGLGLLPNQAEQVLQLTSQITGEARPLPRRGKRTVKKNLLIEPEELPEVYKEPNLPSKSTPFNSFKHDKKKKLNQPSQLNKQSVKDLPPLKSIRPSDPAPDSLQNLKTKTNSVSTKNRKNRDSKLKLHSQKLAKQPMHDVLPASKQTEEFGPVQELQSITLVDFRRLSNNPVEAAARLKQKLQNLKDESFILYLDGKKAWHQSPLFEDYIKAVEKSLSNRKPLNTVNADKKQIQLEEIKALIELEKEI